MGLPANIWRSNLRGSAAIKTSKNFYFYLKYILKNTRNSFVKINYPLLKFLILKFQILMEISSKLNFYYQNLAEYYNRDNNLMSLWMSGSPFLRSLDPLFPT